MKSLAQMALEVRGLNIRKGWRHNDGTSATTFGEYVALLHSEASEALEAWRDHRRNRYTSPDGKPEDVGSELADVLIRLLDMCDIYGYDLEAEYERKMAYNETRPYRHGGRVL